jgi:hypothetical protein
LGEVEAAAEAYRDAMSAVDEAKAAVKRALGEVPPARDHLHAAIVAAYRAGARVRALAPASGYGREQVRRILRKAGIDPD